MVTIRTRPRWVLCAATALALGFLSACAQMAATGDQPTASAPATAVERAQILLAELGHDPGPVDGLQGPRTLAAVRAYQSAAGLRVGGRIGPMLVDHMAATVERQRVIQAQRDLARLGYDPGPADGRAGPQTQIALKAFQEASGLAPDGRLTAELRAALGAAAGGAGGTVAPPQAAAVSAPEAAADDSVPQADTAAVAEEPDREQVAAKPSSPHVLVPGDRLLLSYLGVADKPLVLEVAGDGRVALPEAGRVQAAGLDLPELRDRITVKLIESYMDKLDVSVARAQPASAQPGDGGSAAGPLAPGDRVVVDLGGATSPARLELGADGRLPVPDAGTIEAAGLITEELAAEIKVRLLESYMGKLDVAVDLAGEAGQ